MNCGSRKIKSALTATRKALFFCLGFFLLCQTAVAGQKTAFNDNSDNRDILEDTGLHTSLSEDREVILIKKKPEPVVRLQETVTGTVTDAQSGETLPGVNILVKGTSIGTSTDADGAFELTVESLQDTLVFTYIGFQSKEIPLNGRTTLNVELVAETMGLEEMVVIGFGEQSRRNIVGSVSSVDSTQIASASLNTVDQALQGKVAGVQVTSTSGLLGAPVSVRIRGASSISSSSQPLYVVDGVPVAQNKLGASLASDDEEGGINPLVNLDPSNIKSIEVLKDASAAAVYGSRGANGVVLITTKEGQAGNTQINLSVSQGFAKPTEQYDMLTGPEYARMYNYRVGESVFGQIYTAPNQVINTDWLDLVTRSAAKVQKYNANVSGGDSKTQFFISSSYNNIEGFAQPNQLKKYNATAKINHSFDDKLDVNLKIAPSRSVNSRINTSNSISSPYSLGPLTAPVIPQYYPNGEINDAVNTTRVPTNALSAFTGTPYSNRVGNDLQSTVTQLITNAQVTYNFLPELSLRTQFSNQYLQTEEEFKNADYTTGGYPNGAGSASNGQFLNISWRNTLNYTSDWENSSVTALLGVTFQKSEHTQINVGGNTFISNELKNLNSASSIIGGGGFGSSYAFQNNVGRVTYTYKDRYILTLTGSLNGSSRFGEGNRYGFFPAIAGGWVISDESFAQAEALSFLKLRASYGETGNANIGNFVALPLLSTDDNYVGQPGSVLTQLSKPELSWESTAQLDVGIQYGFLNNRINGSIAYYRKNTNDLLLPVPVSATNGFTSVLKNTGSIRNSGMEFSINADILTGSALSWSVNANIASLNNKVTNLPDVFNNDRIIFGNQVAQEGHPVGAFFMREYKGVDPENGDALYADGNGGTTNNYNTAPRKFVGDPNPDLTGGFGTRLTFKGFDADVNFQFSQGNDIYWSTGGYLATNLSSIFNQVSSQLDYWTPGNTDGSIPEPRPGGNGNDDSSRYLSDGSYLRLKSANIGYTIPQKFVNGYNLRIYAQGTNLLTFTSYVGLDPEVTTTAEESTTDAGDVFFMMPQSRSIIFGIELGI